MEMLKTKKDLPVVPFVVKKVACDCHKRLAKGRCPAVKCNREAASFRKFTKNALMLLFHRHVQTPPDTPCGRNIKLRISQLGHIEQVLELCMFDEPKGEPGRCNEFKKFLLKNVLVEYLVRWCM
jgi:hypothetical protein